MASPSPSHNKSFTWVCFLLIKMNTDPLSTFICNSELTIDFNENAKVYVDIKVDGSGKVVDAGIARGTTTSNSSLRSIGQHPRNVQVVGSSPIIGSEINN
jgi:hypothetical protein